MKLYKDKDWLQQKYWDEELSTYEMAEIAECSAVTIYNWMKKIDIKRRFVSETRMGTDFFENQSNEEIRDWLYKKYWEEELSIIEMADLAGCGQKTICRWMDKYDYERRSISETYKLKWANGDYDNVNFHHGKYKHTKPNGKTIYLDSSWELELCRSLDKNNKKYIRPAGNNGHRYRWIDENGEKHHYTSDLYLIDEDVYLEPHCYKLYEIYGGVGTKEDFNDKIKRVQEQNNIKIIVLDSKNKCSWEYIKEIN